MITVVTPGPLALLQDLGRPGLAHLGVSPSGAADRTAYLLANRLVGNAPDAVAVETVLGGLEVRCEEQSWLVVTGAPTEVVVNGRPTSSHTVITMQRDDELRIETPPLGLRNYLGVRGGLLAPLTLGSCATDVLSHLGPAPLTAHQRLAVGRPSRPMPDVDLAPPNQPRKTLQVNSGPRRDWFADDAWGTLLHQPWAVTSDSNRVAIRLDGPALDRHGSDELPSEAVIRGAIQVPPSGQPLIFGADHPITGGYPVIATLTERDCDHAAQLRPGDTVRFTDLRPTKNR